MHTHSCNPGHRSLETRAHGFMVAAAKAGVHVPTSRPVLSACCYESMSLHLGKPHLKRTV